MDCDTGPHIRTTEPACHRDPLAAQPRPLTVLLAAPAVSALVERPARSASAEPYPGASVCARSGPPPFPPEGCGASVPALSGLASERLAEAISAPVTLWGW